MFWGRGPILLCAWCYTFTAIEAWYVLLRLVYYLNMDTQRLDQNFRVSECSNTCLDIVCLQRLQHAETSFPPTNVYPLSSLPHQTKDAKPPSLADMKPYYVCSAELCKQQAMPLHQWCVYCMWKGTKNGVGGMHMCNKCRSIVAGVIVSEQLLDRLWKSSFYILANFGFSHTVEVRALGLRLRDRRRDKRMDNVITVLHCPGPGKVTLIMCVEYIGSCNSTDEAVMLKKATQLQMTAGTQHIIVISVTVRFSNYEKAQIQLIFLRCWLYWFVQVAQHLLPGYVYIVTFNGTSSEEWTRKGLAHGLHLKAHNLPGIETVSPSNRPTSFPYLMHPDLFAKLKTITDEVELVPSPLAALQAQYKEGKALQGQEAIDCESARHEEEKVLAGLASKKQANRKKSALGRDQEEEQGGDENDENDCWWINGKDPQLMYEGKEGEGSGSDEDQGKKRRAERKLIKGKGRGKGEVGAVKIAKI